MYTDIGRLIKLRLYRPASPVINRFIFQLTPSIFYTFCYDETSLPYATMNVELSMGSSGCIAERIFGVPMVRTHHLIPMSSLRTILAEVFDPDRFLDERLHKYLTPNPFIFLPFNAGPRICLGQQVRFLVNRSHFHISYTFASVRLSRSLAVPCPLVTKVFGIFISA